MKLHEIIATMESWAPLSYQDEWDNSGLIIGDPNTEVTGILISLDTTAEVLQEAISNKCNLVVSHHPLIFHGLKKLTPAIHEYPVIQFAFQNNIGIYALHTNLDNKLESLNHFLGKKLGLEKISILKPKTGYLKKLVTFCPIGHTSNIREALFEAGAGQIGEYDCCSYTGSGQGSFRASDEAKPFVGEKNIVHFEDENRIEVIFPIHIEKKLIHALQESHPYEEVAYDIYPLSNSFAKVGAGILGNLPEPKRDTDILCLVKELFNMKILRHTVPLDRKISKIALCSGSGAFLIPEVIRQGADLFLTGDLKYHDFQAGREGLLLADIGHYESEHFVKEMLYAVLIEKFPTFAVLISEREINPINYL